MNSFLKILGLITLVALIPALSGCAASDTDLGYTRVGPDGGTTDDAHGWGGGPVQPSSH